MQNISETIGFVKLDRLILTVLERWMEQQIQQELDSSLRAGGGDDADKLLQARARLLAEQGDYAEAIALGERRLERMRRSFPEQTALHMKIIGREMLNLSINYASAGQDTQRCLQLRLQVLHMWRSFLPPMHRDLADVMSCVGSSCVSRCNASIRAVLVACASCCSRFMQSGDTERARDMHEGALEIWRQCLQPGDPNYCELPNSLHNLGAACERLNLPELSLKCHEECLQLRRSFLSPSHPDVLHSEAEVAICWQEGGREQDALRLLEKVLAEAKRVLPPTHGHLGLFMNQLGTMCARKLLPTVLFCDTLSMYGRQGRFDSSLKVLQEQLVFCNTTLQPGNYAYVDLHLNMGITLAMLGRKADAKCSMLECLRCDLVLHYSLSVR